MKILSTGDWHLDRMTAGYDRFDDVRSAIHKTVDVAMTEGVELYVFNGDLTNPNNVRSHRAVGTALSVARDLHHMGIDSLWITGNHDVIEDGTVTDGDGFYSTLYPLVGAGYVVSSVPSVHERKSVTIVTLPFPASSHVYDPVVAVKELATDIVVKENPILVVGHLSMTGAAIGSESVEMIRGRSIEWPVAAINEYLPGAVMIGGHYHKQQKCNGVNFAGSLARLGFDEESNDPGYLIVEV